MKKKNQNKKPLQKKALSKQRAVDEKEKQNLSTEITEAVHIPLNTAVYAFGAIKENARIRNEQDADPILKALNATSTPRRI